MVLYNKAYSCDVRRRSSGRSYLRPLGFQCLAWVKDANIMVARAVLLQLLVTVKAWSNVFFCLSTDIRSACRGVVRGAA